MTDRLKSVILEEEDLMITDAEIEGWAAAAEFKPGQETVEPAQPAELMQPAQSGLYPARFAGRRPLASLVENAMAQVKKGNAADDAAWSLEPPAAMRHMMPLKKIGQMKNKPDVLIQYRVKGQDTILEAGSMVKPKKPDHTLRLSIDAGHRGQPKLTIGLSVSLDPAVALDTSKPQLRHKTFVLQFPTGNYDGKHSITNISIGPGAADIQQRAQAAIQRGGPTAITRTIKFRTDFCKAEGFEDFSSMPTGYSAELLEVIKALQAIRLGADVRLSFMLKGNVALTDSKCSWPFSACCRDFTAAILPLSSFGKQEAHLRSQHGKYHACWGGHVSREGRAEVEAL